MSLSTNKSKLKTGYDKDWFHTYYPELLFIHLSLFNPEDCCSRWSKTIKSYADLNGVSISSEELSQMSYKLRKCSRNPANTARRLLDEPKWNLPVTSHTLLTVLEATYQDKYPSLKINNLFHYIMNQNKNFTDVIQVINNKKV
jgi:hypothetical protein